MLPLVLTLAQAATLSVCPTGCDATTVQGAVDLAAPSGDTIALDPGRYRENILIAGKSVVISGADPDTTILDGGFVDTVVLVQSDAAAVLEDLTIQNARSSGSLPGSAGVHSLGGDLSLHRCIVQGNGSGVVAWSPATTLVEGSIIAHNRQHGIEASTPRVELRQNTIVGNGGFGLISYWGAAMLELRYNVFSENGVGALQKYTTDDLTAEHNLTWSNDQSGASPIAGLGDWIDFDGGTHSAFTVDPTNITGDPRFGVLCDRFSLLPGSAAIDAGVPGQVDLDGSPQDLGATGGLDPIHTTRTATRVCVELLVDETPTDIVLTPSVINQSFVELELNYSLTHRVNRRIIDARQNAALGARGFHTGDLHRAFPPSSLVPVLSCIEVREAGLGLIAEACAVVDP